MPNTDFKSIDEYIAAQPPKVQTALKRLRAIIHKAVPRAEEAISYQIAAYKLDGRVMLFFAGWKEHYSLYPAGEKLVKAFKAELLPYEVSKGTIRFPLSEPVPAKLVASIARFKAKETMERANAKAARPKKRVTKKPAPKKRAPKKRAPKKRAPKKR